MEICDAILEHRLSDLKIEYENMATVCKYIVGKGFPYSEEKMIMEIDEDAIKQGREELFYSCFKVKKNAYEPSLRELLLQLKDKKYRKPMSFVKN
ncbi:MAG: hypothetical protein SVM86_04945 [Candidatus Cloacimonadota bacterium]|nr:hypothetical protein [Candidatus Cloacimonadota bacterium]